MAAWLFGDSRVKRENEKPVDVISGFLKFTFLRLRLFWYLVVFLDCGLSFSRT